MRFPLLLVLCLPHFVLAQSADELRTKAKTVLSPTSGDVTVAGLKEPVEIVRDRWGVAHIYAKNADDLFFAQGFNAAADRLFQIDLWRRQATGELAEILGKEFIEADFFARLLKYRGDMEAEWRSYSPDAKAIATAFTSGINAYIEHIGEKLPIEFQLLGYRPKKWLPHDVLGRASGIYMSQNFRNEILRAKLVAAVGIEKARWLAPTDPPREYVSHLPYEDLARIDDKILAAYNQATMALSVKPSSTESNNWVVTPEKSDSGKPLLASDPHRAIALPSLRYIVHLNAPGWNVIGAGEPGLPGIAIGHNERMAWGFTIVGTDQADFYVEETNDAGEYKENGRWTRMQSATEVVHVKGGEKVERVLHFTRHGPVLYRDAKAHRAYALRWAGSEPGGAAYLGSLAIGRAQNRDEFLQAIKAWHIPSLNFVYADVDGNTGWIAAGLIPVRDKHDGLLPVPGDGGFEWKRFLDVKEYPQRIDPKEGFIATANHNIVPKDYPHQIAYEFAAPYRYQRLRELLSVKGFWQLEDFKALQQDSVSVPGRRLAKLLVDVAGGLAHVDLMKGWNGSLATDSSQAVVYAFWVKELQDAFYARHLDKKQAALAASLGGLPTMLDALEQLDARWLGKEAPEEVRRALVYPSFLKALEKWKSLPERQQKNWGALHTVTFRHPIAALSKAHAEAFNVGPFERPGDGNTPNNTRYDDNFKQIHGASYRHLFDLADWDRGLATNAPGQSGQLGSRHYDDLAAMWASGEYFPLYFSRSKIKQVAAAPSLWLRPK
jgi:penicillin amidase